MANEYADRKWMREKILAGQDGSGDHAHLTLAECIRLFSEAWANRDTATLESLLADDYVHTDFEGRVLRRAEWLEYARSQPHGSRVELDDVEIMEHGHFALVIGANRIEGGSMGRATIRFTQVWRRDAGVWKRVAFQATEFRA